MFGKRSVIAAMAASILLVPAACARSGPGVAQSLAQHATVAVESESGAKHSFTVEVARTSSEQARGLMFRTNIGADGGMLFTPYPGDGGPPREAAFWMVNTPTALDILFIRPDGTIARIAADAEPYSRERLVSGEPVGAVLEILAGRTAELGIRVGDKVSWTIDPD